MQFNRKLSNNISVKSLPPNKSVKGKQADISRIPLPISPKPSKSVLVKSKFYKKNQILTSNFQLNKPLLLWQLLVTMTNSNTSNKSLSRILSRDHKRTQ